MVVGGVAGGHDINNIMGGLESTGGVMLHNHKRKLRQRFDLVKKLGQGTYGKVQLGVNKETGQQVAIKTIKKVKIETEADLIRIRREIQIMSSVQHPYIIHIYEVFENREKIVLVMEYAAGGELYDYLSESKVLSEDEARRIFRQVASAVYYCHKHKICHRDLKLENILLDTEGNAKIADFGLSNVFDGKRLLTTFCGSPLYASPEIVRGIPYQGPEVDCWSLGVLLYTLVYGAMPFDGSNFKRLVKQICQGEYYEPKKPTPASPLIRHMLGVEASKRATVEDICSHWWVNEGYPGSCLENAEELANQTPVRLDLLLSLADPPPNAGGMVIGDEPQSPTRGEEDPRGSAEPVKPARKVSASHSASSLNAKSTDDPMEGPSERKSKKRSKSEKRKRDPQLENQPESISDKPNKRSANEQLDPVPTPVMENLSENSEMVPERSQVLRERSRAVPDRERTQLVPERELKPPVADSERRRLTSEHERKAPEHIDVVKSFIPEPSVSELEKIEKIPEQVIEELVKVNKTVAAPPSEPLKRLPSPLDSPVSPTSTDMSQPFLVQCETETVPKSLTFVKGQDLDSPGVDSGFQSIEPVPRESSVPKSATFTVEKPAPLTVACEEPLKIDLEVTETPIRMDCDISSGRSADANRLSIGSAVSDAYSDASRSDTGTGLSDTATPGTLSPTRTFEKRQSRILKQAELFNKICENQSDIKTMTLERPKKVTSFGFRVGDMKSRYESKVEPKKIAVSSSFKVSDAKKAFEIASAVSSSQGTLPKVSNFPKRTIIQAPTDSTSIPFPKTPVKSQTSTTNAKLAQQDVKAEEVSVKIPLKVSKTGPSLTTSDVVQPSGEKVGSKSEKIDEKTNIAPTTTVSCEVLKPKPRNESETTATSASTVKKDADPQQKPTDHVAESPVRKASTPDEQCQSLIPVIAPTKVATSQPKPSTSSVESHSVNESKPSEARRKSIKEKTPASEEEESSIVVGGLGVRIGKSANADKIGITSEEQAVKIVRPKERQPENDLRKVKSELKPLELKSEGQEPQLMAPLSPVTAPVTDEAKIKKVKPPLLDIKAAQEQIETKVLIDSGDKNLKEGTMLFSGSPALVNLKSVQSPTKPNTQTGSQTQPKVERSEITVRVVSPPPRVLSPETRDTSSQTRGRAVTRPSERVMSPPPAPQPVRRERIIPITVEGRDPTPCSRESSVATEASVTSPVSERDQSLPRGLSRQESARRDSIRKSPREFIIPISVEGGGVVTPKPDDGPTEGTGTFGRRRNRHSLMREESTSARGDTQSGRDSPFNTLKKLSSFGKGYFDEKDDEFGSFASRMASRRFGRHLDHSDSSGEEDDDDTFQILTAESLFSNLLSRVRNISRRSHDPFATFRQTTAPRFESSWGQEPSRASTERTSRAFQRPSSVIDNVIRRSTESEASVLNRSSIHEEGTPWRRRQSSREPSVASSFQSETRGPESSDSARYPFQSLLRRSVVANQKDDEDTKPGWTVLRLNSTSRDSTKKEYGRTKSSKELGEDSVSKRTIQRYGRAVTLDSIDVEEPGLGRLGSPFSDEDVSRNDSRDQTPISYRTYTRTCSREYLSPESDRSAWSYKTLPNPRKSQFVEEEEDKCREVAVNNITAALAKPMQRLKSPPLSRTTSPESVACISHEPHLSRGQSRNDAQGISIPVTSSARASSRALKEESSGMSVGSERECSSLPSHIAIRSNESAGQFSTGLPVPAVPNRTSYSSGRSVVDSSLPETPRSLSSTLNCNSQRNITAIETSVADVGVVDGKPTNVCSTKEAVAAINAGRSMSPIKDATRMVDEAAKLLAKAEASIAERFSPPVDDQGAETPRVALRQRAATTTDASGKRMSRFLRPDFYDTPKDQSEFAKAKETEIAEKSKSRFLRTAQKKWESYKWEEAEQPAVQVARVIPTSRIGENEARTTNASANGNVDANQNPLSILSTATTPVNTVNSTGASVAFEPVKVTPSGRSTLASNGVVRPQPMIPCEAEIALAPLKIITQQIKMAQNSKVPAKTELTGQNSKVQAKTEVVLRSSPPSAIPRSKTPPRPVSHLVHPPQQIVKLESKPKNAVKGITPPRTSVASRGLTPPALSGSKSLTPPKVCGGKSNSPPKSASSKLATNSGVAKDSPEKSLAKSSPKLKVKKHWENLVNLATSSFQKSSTPSKSLAPEAKATEVVVEKEGNTLVSNNSVRTGPDFTNASRDNCVTSEQNINTSDRKNEQRNESLRTDLKYEKTADNTESFEYFNDNETPTSYDSRSVCSDLQSDRNLENDEESVSERILRKSFYSRFNDRRKSRRSATKEIIDLQQELSDIANRNGSSSREVDSATQSRSEGIENRVTTLSRRATRNLDSLKENDISLSFRDRDRGSTLSPTRSETSRFPRTWRASQESVSANTSSASDSTSDFKTYTRTPHADTSSSSSSRRYTAEVEANATIPRRNRYSVFEAATTSHTPSSSYSSRSGTSDSRIGHTDLRYDANRFSTLLEDSSTSRGRLASSARSVLGQSVGGFSLGRRDPSVVGGITSRDSSIPRRDLGFLRSTSTGYDSGYKRDSSLSSRLKRY